MDTHCVVCGEPWDVYGLSHGDTKVYHVDAIRSGLGCPCCVSNGHTPLYESPLPIVAFNCHSCKKDIATDPEDWIYDGTKKKYIGDQNIKDYSGSEEFHICQDCDERKAVCDWCGLVSYLELEDTRMFYFQELGALICEDCVENGIISQCEICQQDEYTSEMIEGLCRVCCEHRG